MRVIEAENARAASMPAPAISNVRHLPESGYPTYAPQGRKLNFKTARATSAFVPERTIAMGELSVAESVVEASNFGMHDHQLGTDNISARRARRPQLQIQKLIIRPGDCPLRHKAEVARATARRLEIQFSTLWSVGRMSAFGEMADIGD